MKSEALPGSTAAARSPSTRRQQRVGQGEIISVGELILDGSRHLCLWRQKCVDLTKTEYALLASLSRHPGYVKTRDQLLDEVCGNNTYLMDRTIDGYVKRLRKKLKAADPGFKEIQTVYGLGYRYRLPATDVHH